VRNKRDILSFNLCWCLALKKDSWQGRPVRRALCDE